MPFDLAENFISAAEELLGAKFPDSYRSSMLMSNGGELEIENDVWLQYQGKIMNIFCSNFSSC
ncbi:SMI1/KNR4 family protein [Aeromonas veronii]